MTTSRLSFADTLFLLFFASHIPITLLIDLQGIFHDHYAHQLQQVVKDYVANFRDPFMLRNPAQPWFNSFLVCELFVQLPFFFVALEALWNGHLHTIRIPGVAYGVHVATTVVPLLAELIFGDFESGAFGPRTTNERLALVGVYIGYFLIPLAFAVHVARVPNPSTAKKNQ